LREKTVSNLRERFDVEWVLSIICESAPDLIDREINASFKIYEGGIAPKVPPDLVSVNNFSWPIKQKQQNFERLWR
jgi:hypothetical protein